MLNRSIHSIYLRMPKRLSQEEFNQKRIKIHGNKYDCLDNYIHMHEKLRFKCKHHGIFSQTPTSHIFNKAGCPDCYGNKKKDITYLHHLAKINGLKCLSTEYTNVNTKVLWMCASGHTWEACADKIRVGKCCLKCSYIKGRRKRNGIEHLQKLADKNEGKCISNKYVVNNTHYVWECRLGHQWKSTASHIQQGQWCPICRESKGEKKIREVLLKLKIEHIRQYRFDDCKHKKRLVFDYFLSEHNCCIEYDGEQHFNSFKFFGGNEGLKKRKIKDRIKNLYCVKNEIKLLRIPHIKFDEIEKIILTNFV